MVSAVRDRELCTVPTEETEDISQHVTVHRLCVRGSHSVSAVLTATTELLSSEPLPKHELPNPLTSSVFMFRPAQPWLNKLRFLRSFLISANTAPPSRRPVHNSFCL